MWLLCGTCPGCSLEGLMLKLKLQYFGHLMQRVDSLEKTLMLGGMGGRRRKDDRGWDGWMASLTRWAWVWVNSGSWWWTERPGVLRFMGSKESDTTEQLNWTELDYVVRFLFAYLVSVTFNDVDDNREPGIFLFLWDYSCFIMFC